jgi:DNA-3-methyladenine glycosylase II
MPHDVLLTCPIMAELVARHMAPSFEPEPPFPSLVEAIVSQQISGKAAASIMARLRSLVAIRPTALANSDLRRLRRAGLSRAKAVYVRELARFARAGGLRGLNNLEDVAIVERLTAVKGVGVWTAEMFLIFSLGRPDVWPIGDGGIQRAARNLYGARTPRSLSALGERFRPYRSHAAWYLWRSLAPAPRADQELPGSD